MKNQTLSNIKKGKKLKESIPDYLEGMRQLYEQYGAIQFIFAYYEYCEDKIEKEFMLSQRQKEQMEQMETMFSSVVEQTVDASDVRERLLALREENTKKMGEIMIFVTRVELLEHLLNHLQYKYDSSYDLTHTKESVAQAIYEYIFSERDNVVIDGRVKSLLEQFPAPIVKSKFYDFLSENISLYIGGDKESLERMVDTIRDVACLKEMKSEEETQLVSVLEQLEQKKYRDMTREEFEDAKQFVSNIASQLSSKVDSLCYFQKVINYFEALLLCDIHIKEQDQSQIFELLAQATKEREKLKQAEVLFFTLEGKQEQLLTQIDEAAPYLEQLKEMEQQGKISLEQEEWKEKQETLILAGKLLSDQLFLPLEATTKEVVTKEEAKKTTEQLIEQFKVFFKGHERLMNQSVMARTLSILPVVYKTQREVANYIEYAINQSNSMEQIMANFELYHLVQGEI